MYVIDKCIVNENGQLEFHSNNMYCTSHYQMLAHSLNYIRKGIKDAKKKKKCTKLVRLIYFGCDYGEVIGQITNEAIYDWLGNEVFSLVPYAGTDFYINKCVFDCTGVMIYNKKVMGGVGTQFNGQFTGIYLMSAMVSFLTGRTMISSHTKECYMYDKRDNLLLIMNKLGIYDKDRKQLLNFNIFIKSNQIKKRSRDFTFKDRIK